MTVGAHCKAGMGEENRIFFRFLMFRGGGGGERRRATLGCRGDSRIFTPSLYGRHAGVLQTLALCLLYIVDPSHYGNPEAHELSTFVHISVCL